MQPCMNDICKHAVYACMKLIGWYNGKTVETRLGRSKEEVARHRSTNTRHSLLGVTSLEMNQNTVGVKPFKQTTDGDKALQPNHRWGKAHIQIHFQTKRWGKAHIQTKRWGKAQ